MSLNVGTTATFHKGMVVKVKAEREAVSYANGNSYPARCYEMWRKTTAEELQAWRDSDASKGMDCAGETKLHSGTTYRQGTTPDEVFKIVRARVKARQGWNDIAGCAVVEDADGTQWFVKRSHIH